MSFTCDADSSTQPKTYSFDSNIIYAIVEHTPYLERFIVHYIHLERSREHTATSLVREQLETPD